MKHKKEIINISLSLLSILLILLLWAIAAHKANSEYILPTINQTLISALKLLKSTTFYQSLLGTLYRTAISFCFSFLIAFLLAFLTYKSQYAKAMIAPFIRILRALPTIATILLILFWTNSKIAPMIVTIIVVLPTLYTDIINAFFGIDKEVIEMCNIFRVPKNKILLKVELPQILPQILLAIGAGFSLNLKLMVAAEVLAQTSRSMGYLLNTSKVYFEIATMLALVLFTVIIGVAIESIFNLLSKKAGKHL